MSSELGSTAPGERFEKRHDFLVAVDSDGCAFDTMGWKHRECFTPQIIEFWGLEPIGPLVEQTEQFVNLYSRWRGLNRFAALLRLFDLLRDRPEVRAAGVEIPHLASLRAFVESGRPLSNAGLEAFIAERDDPELRGVLAWSQAVNQAVAERADRVRPFPSVKTALARISRSADVVVVSQMPQQACREEWRAHGLAGLVGLLGGQELGSKAEQLRAAMGRRYQPQHVLMVGDAPGDLEAAQANAAMFFPINPGQEESCWQRLRDEALEVMLAERFAGPYQQALIEQFWALLPQRPPWADS